MSNPFNTPFAQPQAVTAPAASGSVGFEIPADPTWEPLEFADVLDHDGYFCAKIIAEKQIREKFVVSFELQDEDVRGKRLDKWFSDPRIDDKAIDQWRALLLAISGSKDAARGRFSYVPGRVTGATVYLKSGAFIGNKGEQRTGIDKFITKEEHAAAVAQGKHRWPAVARDSAPKSSGFGALPAGLPVAFPGVPAVQTTQPAVPSPPQQLSFSPTVMAIIPDPVSVPNVNQPETTLVPPPAPATNGLPPQTPATNGFPRGFPRFPG